MSRFFLPVPLLIVAVSVVLFAQVLAQDGCINEPTQCTCSEQASSGECSRFQGDGKCLMGACSASPRCDCFGFEKCSIRKCGQYMPKGGAVPSADRLFDCELERDSTECRVITGVMDNMEAADNAKDASNVFVDNATDDEEKAAEAIQSVVKEKKEAIAVVREVEIIEANVPEAELADLKQDLEEVQALVRSCQAKAKEVEDLSAKSFNAMRRCKLERKEGKKQESKIKELEAQLEAASDETRKNTIRRDIEATKEKRRAACQRSATAAVEAREAQKGCNRARREAQENAAKCNRARKRCSAKSTKLRGRYSRQ